MYHTTTFDYIFSTGGFHTPPLQAETLSNKLLSSWNISFWRRRLSKGGNPDCIAE